MSLWDHQAPPMGTILTPAGKVNVRVKGACPPGSTAGSGGESRVLVQSGWCLGGLRPS
jgi:hypothetical protein